MIETVTESQNKIQKTCIQASRRETNSRSQTMDESQITDPTCFYRGWGALCDQVFTSPFPRALSIYSDTTIIQIHPVIHYSLSRFLTPDHISQLNHFPSYVLQYRNADCHPRHWALEQMDTHLCFSDVQIDPVKGNACRWFHRNKLVDQEREFLDTILVMLPEHEGNYHGLILGSRQISKNKSFIREWEDPANSRT